MKIMLHGATNMSNYGDYIFAELFMDALKTKGHEVLFYSHPKYGISDYFAKYLRVAPDRRNYKKDLKLIDCFIFISGGYFVEPRKPGVLSEYKHYCRYLKPAMSLLRCGKPIYILGVGAGPFKNKRFSRSARKIINYASVVTVRDEESKQYCDQFGIYNDIIVTSDTALLIGEYLNNKKQEIPKFNIDEGRKMLLFHIDSNQEVKEKISSTIAPAIIRFLNDNPEYKLFLAADGVKDDVLYEEYRSTFAEAHPTVLIYDNPWELTRQIERADLIVTTKLHMGIVGSALGRSVVSFPFVPQKTKRFYKQIGEPDRCVSLTDITTDKVYGMLEAFKKRRIQVPNEFIKKARLNLEYLPK